jgi:hypothetical protein
MSKSVQVQNQSHVEGWPYFFMSKLIACIMMMMMGGVSSRGGSREVDRFMVIVQLKMEDVCILRNVIEILK